MALEKRKNSQKYKTKKAGNITATYLPKLESYKKIKYYTVCSIIFMPSSTACMFSGMRP